MKKLLSLTLALALLCALLVVPAGAAFTDQEKITHTEAVAGCVELGLLSGYPDGSYQPTGGITRAELCKLVCLVLNGGKEPDLSKAPTVTFTDTKGHWAEDYIAWCADKGIVSGMGDGKFAPNDGVTASQAAKILLVALGCDAQKENYTGALWAVNVNARANEVGLYAGLDGIEVGEALTRDSAAQMLWNTLNAAELEYVEGTGMLNGKEYPKTTLEQKLQADGKTPLTLKFDKFGK